MILHKLFHFSLLITHDTLTITTALCWLLKKNSLIPAASNIRSSSSLFPPDIRGILAKGKQFHCIIV